MDLLKRLKIQLILIEEHKIKLFLAGYYPQLVMQLRYELDILIKESMIVKEYYNKMKLLANKLACAGDTITEKDLLMRILNGLWLGYLDLASIITANKMRYDDVYALLLTNEAKIRTKSELSVYVQC